MEGDIMPGELKHYGREGMKWYQHIFGDKNKGSKKSKSGNESEEDRIERRKKEVASSRSAKKVYENANLFSDQELQRIYNRIQLERNIKNLSANEKSKGERYVDKVIKTARKTSELINVGKDVYNGVAIIYNLTATKNGKSPLPIISTAKKKKK